MKIFNKFSVVALAAAFGFGLTGPFAAHAYSNPVTVPLLTVSNFAALAHTAISSPLLGTTLNNGDLGIDGVGCTDFPTPCTTPGTKGTVIGGVIQNNNGVAAQGQLDANAAVTNIGLRSSNETLATDLGGQTLTQGVYTVAHDATSNLTGNLTLNGDANSVFIFHLTSDLVTSTGSSVILGPGVQACNVFWKVDTQATFNGTTQFVGTVLAGTSVVFSGGGATLDGRAIAQTAALTFNNTTVNNTSCTGGGGNQDTGLIKVTKEASKTALLSGPAKVTFTYRVTNKGDVAISNVSVKDDKCDSVDYASGDSNGDGLLDTSETWVYRCEKTVKKTETNTVTAKGTANGEEVRDTDTAKVTVSTPGLPATGVGPADGSSAPWNVIVPTSIFAVLFSFYLARKKLAI